ncbi:hypothetical protein RND71_005603 [Anisodus tanguticus]|uniref:NAD-dependent epimerase/dehydratase domain-containing protein n=1 Tax=Anisodus tanguticus TaxID=243964 RepID=A0AAE1SSG7_9SOLA|nr:hypothetical protein RND71_005603 [Anisodus tanguticus]
MFPTRSGSDEQEKHRGVVSELWWGIERRGDRRLYSKVVGVMGVGVVSTGIRYFTSHHWEKQVINSAQIRRTHGMSVLVTGAAGFVGSHVSLALKKRGDGVVGIDNFNNYYDVLLKKLERIYSTRMESSSPKEI